MSFLLIMVSTQYSGRWMYSFVLHLGDGFVHAVVFRGQAGDNIRLRVVGKGR